MPNSLSVRDQNSFISAYKNLLNDNDKRIHKNDINTLSKILNKCDKVEVGQLLMTKMESYPKEPAALKNTFIKLFDKLEAQNSRLYSKKEEKLKNIQQKLVPVVQDINKIELNAHNAKINGEIKRLADDLQLISKNSSQEKNNLINNEGNIAKADVQIKKLHNEIKTLADELNNTSPEVFEAKDAQDLKEAEEKMSQLDAKKSAEINILNNKIAAHENSRTVLLDFARRHGVIGAEQDFRKADSGAIYDNRDTGFGTTSWREHIGSDRYAIKHFGHDLKEGRRQYSDLIKVPNHEGKQWQKLMQNFNDASKNIKALQRQISQIKNKYKNDIGQVKFENRFSAKQDIEQRIDYKKESIRSLEKNKELALGEIKSCHGYISALEARKSPLIARIEELKSHIKRNS